MNDIGHHITEYLIVLQSPSRGRGVFVTKDFSHGEIISSSFSWELDETDLYFFDRTSVSGHWFYHPDLSGHGLLPIGTAALINHSSTPNCKIVWSLTNIGYVGVTTAIVPIKAGDELFIDYEIDMPNGWI